MARKNLDIGNSPNDGTGDRLRNAMIKINDNFIELYNGQFSGSYGDLTDKPTIPTDLTDLGISDGSFGQVLTTDGSGTFTFTTVSGGGNTSTLDSLTDVTITSPVSGQILKYDGIGWVNGTDETASTGGGLVSRTIKSGTTGSIANDANANLDITGFKSYGLMSIQTDKAAWVRIYVNTASRTADASRLETSDPLPDAGVIAEVITTGPETILISPGVFGYNTDGTTTIRCAVKNKSGSTDTVTVSLTLLQLEI